MSTHNHSAAAAVPRSRDRAPLGRGAVLLAALMAAVLPAQETVKVEARPVDRRLKLPGELLPFQRVALHARVTGFVEKVEVDRGSAVKAGRLLVLLSAPEMASQLAAARARVGEAESRLAEARAKLLAAESSAERLKAAAATAGAVAGIEVILAEKSVEAARALVASLERARDAALAAVKTQEELESYLRVTAPFDGIVTGRHVHPGALVGPGTANTPLLTIEEHARLRLVAPVPETEFSGVAAGTRVSFSVPDQPGTAHAAVVARIPRSLDAKTRTMPVELDVDNRTGGLAPGMFADVAWPVRRAAPALLAPATAVVTTTERSFVIRVEDGKAKWVNVTRVATAGELVEVLGNLRAGDVILKRASDEIREGTPVRAPK